MRNLQSDALVFFGALKENHLRFCLNPDTTIAMGMMVIDVNKE